ncbi:MAG: polysaccharide biosynthesis tyrosine autokinase [Deltaproteobacteria bacterium]|jgi:protein-tyrosine kinase
MGRVFKALGKVSQLNPDPSAVPDPSAESQKHYGAGTFATDDQAAADETFHPAQTTSKSEVSPGPQPGEEQNFFNQPEEQKVQKWHERLVAATETASLVGEEFRRLRTHILHPPNNKKPPRTILVVSAVPEEGKSLVCAGLGLALAQGVKEHALLIDCDLRRPSLAGLFGLPNDKGLSDYLQSGTDLGRLIRKTGFRKLSIIPSGRPPYNPAELLGSERLTAMIDEVANRYPDRFVVFDSPPLRNAAETAILAKQLEGIVLVVREGKSRREDVSELVETIGPEKIVGLVYNDYRMNLLENKMTGRSYYNYYSSSSSGSDA